MLWKTESNIKFKRYSHYIISFINQKGNKKQTLFHSSYPLNLKNKKKIKEVARGVLPCYFDVEKQPFEIKELTKNDIEELKRKC